MPSRKTLKGYSWQWRAQWLVEEYMGQMNGQLPDNKERLMWLVEKAYRRGYAAGFATQRYRMKGKQK